MNKPPLLKHVPLCVLYYINNVEHGLIIVWEIACAMKPLPSRDYVINQWTGMFIYNKITSIIIHIYVLIISYVDFRPGSKIADEMVLFGNRQSLLDVSNYLTHN